MAHLSDQEYVNLSLFVALAFEASANAAKVAVSLLSYARAILKLDSVRTEYSAQYLLDNVCLKKQAGQGETLCDCSNLTAKDCLEFVLKEGIPKVEGWPHLGCLFKPPSSYIPPLVSMKGQVIEPKNWDEAKMFFKQQPVGARLHVFSPELDEHVGEEGVYVGRSSYGSCYVGLRDVLIDTVQKIGELLVVTVELYHNKKVAYVNVALDVMCLGASSSDESQVIKPGPLLVDFFLPRLSIN